MASILAISAADLFRGVWPQHTAKHVARAADRPLATARSWISRRYTPDADTFLAMTRECAELRAELRRTLDRMELADAGVAGLARGTVRAPAVELVGDGGGASATPAVETVKP